MNNIYLHSYAQPKGILKENINKPKEEVIGSILPSKIFDELPSKPVDRLAELKRISLDNFSPRKRVTGFSCLAEFNYYHNVGG